MFAAELLQVQQRVKSGVNYTLLMRHDAACRRDDENAAGRIQ